MPENIQLNHLPPSSNRPILILFLVWVIIVVRLWYLQIYKGETQANKAKQNLLRTQTIYAPRGIIRDRQGIILADNKPAYDLALVRENAHNCTRTIKRISQLTGIDLNLLLRQFYKEKKRVKPFNPQIIYSNLDPTQLAKLEVNSLDFPEIQIIHHPYRTYNFGKLTAHVLGYVAEVDSADLKTDPALEPGDKIGKQGLEFTFEKTLRGTKGLQELEVNAQGRILKSRVIKRPIPGQDMSLTIDLHLQDKVWQALGNHTGSCLVLEPYTGQVLALVSKPSYDNNLFVQGISPTAWQALLTDKRHPLQNRAIQSAYPPGSVFKLVVAACGLANHALNPRKKVFCPGFYKLGNRVFNCWKKHGHGWVDLKNGLKQSCDVYFYNLGEQLGVEMISEFAQKNGFNTLTGIDLPHEKKGLIPDPIWKQRRFGKRWQGGETLNLAIGQGYTQVTPLQVARFIAALVNGGFLLKPQLILHQPPEVQKKIPLRTWQRQVILKAMRSAVEEPHGTALILKTKGILIGAKTGTAQVIKLKEEYKDLDTKEIPYKYRDHAWMAAYGQQGKKDYVVVAMVEHGGHGASGAGPIVRSVLHYLFNKSATRAKDKK